MRICTTTSCGLCVAPQNPGVYSLRPPCNQTSSLQNKTSASGLRMRSTMGTVIYMVKTDCKCLLRRTAACVGEHSRHWQQPHQESRSTAEVHSSIQGGTDPDFVAGMPCIHRCTHTSSMKPSINPHIMPKHWHILNFYLTKQQWLSVLLTCQVQRILLLLVDHFKNTRMRC